MANWTILRSKTLVHQKNVIKSVKGKNRLEEDIYNRHRCTNQIPLQERTHCGATRSVVNSNPCC